MVLRWKRGLVSPPPSSPAVAAAMRGNRSADTLPEVLLAAALRQSGLRSYRKHCRELPGKPDLVFRGARVVVFVHGCFWHSCPKCKIALPRRNTDYWQEKLRRNRVRDLRTEQELTANGWRVVHVWECEVHSSVGACVARVNRSIARARLASKSTRR
jgi:DNA mismatch endonuclease (patch repair protein)